MTKPNLKDYLFLHIILLMYSTGGIFSKLASNGDFLSMEFIFYYVLVLLVLFVYALLWQQLLKRMPLTTAFLNKSVVIIWGILWGKVIFKEEISIFMIIGAILILFGLTLVVKADE